MIFSESFLPALIHAHPPSAAIAVVLPIVTLPLPGYIAKAMNKIQTERMKRVIILQDLLVGY